MSTTSSPVAAPQCVQTPLSVQRPALSPRKRKSSAIEAASPTSLDEVTPSSSNSHSTSKNNSNSYSRCTSSKSLEERVISPKKKTKAEDRSSSSSGSDQNKWESHVATGVASALDLDAMESFEPVSFSAEPAGDLSAAELELLCRLLA